MTYVTLGLTAVAVCITLFIHPVLRVMVTPGFRVAARYAGWIALAYLIRAFSRCFREIFVIDKRPDLEAWVSWAGAAVVFTGYAILIPRYGVWGAVWATLGGFAIQCVVSYFVAQSVRRVDYEYLRLAKIAAGSLAITVLFAAVPAASFWMQVALGCALAALFVLLLLMMRLFTSAELDYVTAQWRAFVSKGETTLAP
jgi:O-antigen/teichoic acid export membrane protein